MRSNAILNIANTDKCCFSWSILAYLHPCENSHPSRVKNYKQYFHELNIKGFDFTNEFKCSDVDKFEKLNILSINIFELNFYQDQNKRKHNLILFENSKNDESDRLVDSLVYRKNYALLRKLKVILGDHR